MQNAPSSPSGHVLFIDDDADVLKAADLLLARNGLRMTAARSPAEAWSILAAEPVDAILLDLNFTRGATSGQEGFGHLKEILTQDSDAVVVVVTGHSGVNIAVAAMRAGAADFVMKPWSNDRLVATLRTAAALRHQRREAAAQKEIQANVGTAGESTPLLGDSAAIQRVRDLIRRTAPTDAPVLIYGAAGTGKSLIARNIHLHSRRAAGPFVPVDFTTLTPDDVERALFGDGTAPGALLAAHGGTLGLDAVDALPPSLQGRLEGVLERGHLDHVELGRAIAVDVRIVSSTRRGRADLQGPNGLRDDLLYRLNTVEIHAPVLLARAQDALILARHFLRLYARRYDRPDKALAPDAVEAVLNYAWPGDVRALRQAMERCVIFAEGEHYELSDLALAQAPDAAPIRADLDLAQSERAMVEAALKRHSFNVSHAARQLGLSRAALYRRMAKHGL